MEIAGFVGVSQKIIWRLMANHQIGARPAIKRNQWGDKNHSWKGSAVGYAGIHRRVEVERGKPSRCAVCGCTDPHKKYDWANVTGDYTTTSGFVRMCRSCHFKNDKIIDNIKNKKER